MTHPTDIGEQPRQDREDSAQAQAPQAVPRSVAEALIRLDTMYRDLHDEPGERPEWLRSALEAAAAPAQAVGEMLPLLTDERIEEVLSATFRRLHAAGYSGGMGSETWDRAAARAIESEVRAALAAPKAAAPQEAQPVAYTDEPEQDAILAKFAAAGFQYDGFSGWQAFLSTPDLLGLAAALASPPSDTAAVPQWISIDERMPEPKQSVALVNVSRWENVGGDDWERNVHACGYWDNWGGGHWSVRGERALTLESFTHWMPLPAAPTTGKEG